MKIAPYDHDRDVDAVRRIWTEIGWLNPENEDALGGLDLLLEAGRSLVARLDGEAECLVVCAAGETCYLEERLPLSGVMAVTTSLVARRMGIAQRLTAQAIAEEVLDGAVVSCLSMFEEGFYNLLGFGTGPYVHEVSFAPQDLKVAPAERPPRRLSKADWKAMHAARLHRMPSHGATSFPSDKITAFNVTGTKAGFGLGYFDGPDSSLSHYLWFVTKDLEHGPYRVDTMVYRSHKEFLELMGLLKNLGDQVLLVRMNEPAGIQLQDFVSRTIQRMTYTKGSKFDSGTRALAIWQRRLCDLEAALEKTHLRCDTLRFNLVLSDPIERYLDASSKWRGVAGEYLVTLGADCAAESGTDASLPTLKASVNAFTRMWLGVQPATGLRLTEELEGPADLLDTLDWAFRLPCPQRDWDY